MTEANRGRGARARISLRVGARRQQIAGFFREGVWTVAPTPSWASTSAPRARFSASGAVSHCAAISNTAREPISRSAWIAVHGASSS
jgi:hypothetical protein